MSIGTPSLITVATPASRPTQVRIVNTLRRVTSLITRDYSWKDFAFEIEGPTRKELQKRPCFRTDQECHKLYSFMILTQQSQSLLPRTEVEQPCNNNYPAPSGFLSPRRDETRERKKRREKTSCSER